MSLNERNITASSLNGVRSGAGLPQSMSGESNENGAHEKKPKRRRTSVLGRWLLLREQADTLRARNGEWLGAETLLVSPLEQTRPANAPASFNFDELPAPLLKAAARLGYLPVELMSAHQIDLFFSADVGDPVAAERNFLSLMANAQLAELERLGSDVQPLREDLAKIDETVALRIQQDARAERTR